MECLPRKKRSNICEDQIWSHQGVSQPWHCCSLSKETSPTSAAWSRAHRGVESQVQQTRPSTTKWQASPELITTRWCAGTTCRHSTRSKVKAAKVLTSTPEICRSESTPTIPTMDMTVEPLITENVIRLCYALILCYRILILTRHQPGAMKNMTWMTFVMGWHLIMSTPGTTTVHLKIHHLGGIRWLRRWILISRACQPDCVPHQARTNNSHVMMSDGSVILPRQWLCEEFVMFTLNGTITVRGIHRFGSQMWTFCLSFTKCFIFVVIMFWRVSWEDSHRATWVPATTVFSCICWCVANKLTYLLTVHGAMFVTIEMK